MGGSGSQKFVYQKWPDQIFPLVNFVFSDDGHFGAEGGGGPGRGTRPPPEAYGRSTASMTGGSGGGGQHYSFADQMRRGLKLLFPFRTPHVWSDVMAMERGDPDLKAPGLSSLG